MLCINKYIYSCAVFSLVNAKGALIYIFLIMCCWLVGWFFCCYVAWYSSLVCKFENDYFVSFRLFFDSITIACYAGRWCWSCLHVTAMLYQCCSFRITFARLVSAVDSLNDLLNNMQASHKLHLKYFGHKKKSSSSSSLASFIHHSLSLNFIMSLFVSAGIFVFIFLHLPPIVCLSIFPLSISLLLSPCLCMFLKLARILFSMSYRGKSGPN